MRTASRAVSGERKLQLAAPDRPSRPQAGRTRPIRTDSCELEGLREFARCASTLPFFPSDHVCTFFTSWYSHQGVGGWVQRSFWRLQPTFFPFSDVIFSD